MRLPLRRRSGFLTACSEEDAPRSQVQSVAATVALRGLCVAQGEDVRSVRRLALEEPAIAEFLVLEGTAVADQVGLLDFARERILEAPEAQRRQRAASVGARSLRWRLRVPRKRLTSSSEGGALIESPQAAGRMLERHW